MPEIECKPFSSLFKDIKYSRRKKIYFWMCRKWDSLLDATYWKIRNWNWKSPKPRGFDSRHGYAELPELIPSMMFTFFVRWYENEYLKYSYIYTEKDIKEAEEKYPDYFPFSPENIKQNLKYQERIAWLYNWILTSYDVYEKTLCQQPNEKYWEYEQAYHKEERKAMMIIVRYHKWMWS